MDVPLNVSASVVLSGTGAGTVSLGPTLPGVSWNPTAVAVVVTPISNSVTSVFKLYSGIAQASNFIAGSYTGDINSAGLGLSPMQAGQILTGVWSGGNPGATATMTLTGTQTIQG
jgi:hypothetical protein